MPIFCLFCLFLFRKETNEAVHSFYEFIHLAGFGQASCAMSSADAVPLRKSAGSEASLDLSGAIFEAS